MKEDFYPNGHPLGIVARAIALANAKWFQKYGIRIFFKKKKIEFQKKNRFFSLIFF
jgi:hypothetical protein